jgi:hypothetical protein
VSKNKKIKSPKTMETIHYILDDSKNGKGAKIH